MVIVPLDELKWDDELFAFLPVFFLCLPAVDLLFDFFLSALLSFRVTQLSVSLLRAGLYLISSTEVR